METNSGKKINVIEIKWEGPFNFEDIKEQKAPNNGFESLLTDYGLYQMYGNHYMYGSHTLLYIGSAAKRTFRGRLLDHEWINDEASDISLYLGRLGGIEQNLTDDDWIKYILDAEKLMIYFCSPPYNSSNIGSYYDMNPTIVLNFGKRNKLPAEFSTLYKRSDYWPKRENGLMIESKWKCFEWKGEEVKNL